MLIEMPASEYHAESAPQFADVPHLSASIGKILISKTPYHAWRAHPKLGNAEREEKEVFDIGSAAHDLLLEGTAARICVIDADDWRTKVAKEAREEARSNGLRPILSKHNAALQKMVEAARKFVAGSEVAGVFDDGKPEQTAIWKAGDVHCKARFDWLTNDSSMILDYKTTDYISPEFCTRQVERLGYDFQEAFYRRAVKHTRGVDPQFVFLFQETSEPYSCLLVACAPSLHEIAAANVQRAINLWGDCLATDTWPGYGGRIHWAEASAWKMSQYEQSLMEDE